jgi:hypothetical protein
MVNLSSEEVLGFDAINTASKCPRTRPSSALLQICHFTPKMLEILGDSSLGKIVCDLNIAVHDLFEDGMADAGPEHSFIENMRVVSIQDGGYKSRSHRCCNRNWY